MKHLVEVILIKLCSLLVVIRGIVLKKEVWERTKKRPFMLGSYASSWSSEEGEEAPWILKFDIFVLNL